MLKSPLLLLFFLCLAAGMKAQETDAELPRIFVLGANEKAHMEVDSAYTESLLNASQNNMRAAQRSWLNLLVSMEDYAHQIKFPLDGIKVYIHLYCDGTGKINHLGFLPLADSRNVPMPELRAFFSSFTRHNDFPASPCPRFKFNSKVDFPLMAHVAKRGSE